MAAPPPLKLYRSNGSCSIVPHSILLHYDIPFTPVVMRSAAGTQMSDGGFWEAADGSLSNEDYLAINPMGYVPAITVGGGTDDATTITENLAVMTYIASLIPKQNLLGTGDLDRARVAEWMAWLLITVHSNGFGALARQYRFVTDRAMYGAVRERGREVVTASYERINERLEGRKFAVGDALTIVDFYLYPFWRWGELQGFDMQKYAAYGRHLRKIEALEGVRKALVAEGLAPCFGDDSA